MTELKNFYTPEKVEMIFKELEIDKNTDPIVARTRIETFLRLQKVKLSETAMSQNEDTIELKKQNEQFITRIATAKAENAASIVIKIQDASNFETDVENSTISMHFRAGSARISSKSTAFAKNPDFKQEQFEIQIADQLLSLEEFFELLQFTPLSIVVLQRKPDGCALIESEADIDFSLFIEEQLKEIIAVKDVDLHAFGDSSHICGKLALQISFQGMKEENFDKNSLLSQIVAFRARKVTNNENYEEACKLFKAEYIEAVNSSSNVYIPLLLRDDSDELVPASSLIQPLYCKEINTIQKAYRFAQLFPCSIEQTEKQVFSRPFVTLTRGSGSEEDRAILLCSLLRGLQAPAFVITGATAQKYEFFAVVMIYADNFELFYQNEIYVFEKEKEGEYACKSGQEYLSKLDVEKIDSLFNDEDIFVNYASQSVVTVDKEQSKLAGVSFSLISSIWKRMECREIELQEELPPEVVSFLPQDADICASALEQKLWQLIQARRADVGHATPISEPLSRLLGQSLPIYEFEQLSGIILGNEEFKICCKNYVQEGYELIAFPMQVSGPLKFHAPSVFRALLSCDEGKKAIESIGEGLEMGLRVYCEGYAETICSVWIIVGSCYKVIV